jgi:hypothetical protein
VGRTCFAVSAGACAGDFEAEAACVDALVFTPVGFARELSISTMRACVIAAGRVEGSPRNRPDSMYNRIRIGCWPNCLAEIDRSSAASAIACAMGTSP